MGERMKREVEYQMKENRGNNTITNTHGEEGRLCVVALCALHARRVPEDACELSHVVNKHFSHVCRVGCIDTLLESERARE